MPDFQNLLGDLATEAKQDAQIVGQDAMIVLETSIRDLLALIEAQTPTLVGGEVPVTALTDAELRATPVPVSATIPGVATEVTLADLLAKVISAPSTEAKQDAIITALGGVATQATLSALLAKVIAAPATEAKQDASITSLGTDGAAPPAISGTGIRGWLRAIYERLLSTLTVSITGTPNVNTGLSQPLTDAELRAAPIEVEGNLSITGGATEAKQDTIITNTARAYSVGNDSPGSPGTVFGTTMQGIRRNLIAELNADGRITSAQFDRNGSLRVAASNEFKVAETANWSTGAQSITINTNGFSSVTVTIRGTYATFTPLFEVSQDGTNFFALPAVAKTARTIVAAAGVATGANASLVFAFDCTGFPQARVRTSAGPATGSAAVHIAANAMPLALDIQTVNTPSGTQTVSGTVTATVTSTVANMGLMNNSRVDESVANLGVGATFTGPARDNGATGSAQAFGAFVVSVFADQASASNGVIIEGSIDGATNWRVLKTATLVANVCKTIGLPTVFRFHRVRYVNGAVATTALAIISNQHRTSLIPFEQ